MFQRLAHQLPVLSFKPLTEKHAITYILDGAFLGGDGIIRVLAEKKPIEYIPDGVKENVYFVIKNEKKEHNDER